MTMKRRSKTAPLLAPTGLVPASVCARLGGLARTSIHRAVERGALQGHFVGARLYVDWASFRAFAGPLAALLPETAQAAVEA